MRILTPFICDFGNRVKFGKGVFINHSAILSASGGIEFEDGSMAAPGLRIATINHEDCAGTSERLRRTSEKMR